MEVPGSRLSAYPSCALFSAPPCAVTILNGAISSAPIYLFFKCQYTSFCYSKKILLQNIVFCYPSCALFCSIVCSYYFEWWPIERTCLLYIQRSVYLNLQQQNLLALKHVLCCPSCTFFCPIVCSYYLEWCPIVFGLLLLRKLGITALPTQKSSTEVLLVGG